MQAVGLHSGKISLTAEYAGVSTKLRSRETMGFRPENDAQEKLILDAQKATGLKIAELLRRAVIMGLPAVVSEIRAEQEQAFEHFETQLREQSGQSGRDSPKRKAG